jgi:hypothetical protein
MENALLLKGYQVLNFGLLFGGLFPNDTYVLKMDRASMKVGALARVVDNSGSLSSLED